MNRFLKLISVACLLLMAIVLSACGGTKETAKTNNPEKNKEEKQKLVWERFRPFEEFGETTYIRNVYLDYSGECKTAYRTDISGKLDMTHDFKVIAYIYSGTNDTPHYAMEFDFFDSDGTPIIFSSSPDFVNLVIDTKDQIGETVVNNVEDVSVKDNMVFDASFAGDIVDQLKDGKDVDCMLQIRDTKYDDFVFYEFTLPAKDINEVMESDDN